MWELTTNEVALIELEKSLSMKKNNRHHIQCTSTSVGGDYNLPGCYWKNQVVQPCSYPALHHQFGNLLDDSGLIQLDTLDLTLSNNPSSTMNISVLPGVSGHDCHLINIYLEPIRYKQKPTEIPLFNKARWDAFEEDLTLIGKFLCDEHNGLSANDIWRRLKTTIHEGINKYVWHKRYKSKDHLRIPWITRDIKKLITRMDI